MHRIRTGVQENRLTDPARVTEDSYLPFIAAGTIWVAQADDAILGFSALDLGDDSVWALFVAPEAHGAGIGRALHQAMLRSARAHGIARLWLNTGQGTRAERFYIRAGWQAVEAGATGELRLEIALQD